MAVPTRKDAGGLRSGGQDPGAADEAAEAVGEVDVTAVDAGGSEVVIMERGLWAYLRTYTRPTIFMLPFNIIGELSRTIALAIRLYGNVMSGSVIVAILITLTPFVFPIVMQLLGLLTGMIQAYIFAVLATVYIASAARTAGRNEESSVEEEPSGSSGST